MFVGSLGTFTRGFRIGYHSPNLKLGSWKAIPNRISHPEEKLATKIFGSHHLANEFDLIDQSTAAIPVLLLNRSSLTVSE